MAIFSKLILGSAVLSSVALAAPFGAKPAWTVTETDYTTIDATTTIYIDDSKTMSGGFQPTFAAPPTSTWAAVETSYPVPTIAVPSTTLSTSVTPTASPASFYTPSSSTTPSSSSTPPATTTPATTPAAVMTSWSSTTAAAAATSSAALYKNAGTGAPSSASDSASCQGETAACQGDITYYGGGLGACGVNVDPAGNGIALPYEFMGTLSNTNPYCGKTLTIYNPATGQSAQATVMDKCMGCVGRSIDLTQTLFDAVTNGDTAAGRVSGVDWWFN